MPAPVYPLRPGTVLVEFPPEAGGVVSMIKFYDRIYVACQFRVYELNGGVLKPVLFVAQSVGAAVGVK